MPTEPRAEPDGQVVRRVLDALDRFGHAMLVTRSGAGALHARPMLLAGRDADGTVWFVAGTHSSAVDDVASTPDAAALFQGGGLHLALSGEAAVVDDAAHLRRLWRETFREWFPNGPDDGALTLLRLRPTSADLWDLRGRNRLQNVWNAARTWLLRDSAEVHLHHAHQHTAM